MHSWSVLPEAPLDAPGPSSEAFARLEYLRGWLRARRDLTLALEELWRIREACILALSAA